MFSQVDCNVVALVKDNLPGGLIHDFNNLMATTLAVIQTIYVDSYGPGTAHAGELGDPAYCENTADFIINSDPSFGWFRWGYLLSAVGTRALSKYLSAFEAGGGAETTAGKILVHVFERALGMADQP